MRRAAPEGSGRVRCVLGVYAVWGYCTEYPMWLAAKLSDSVLRMYVCMHVCMYVCMHSVRYGTSSPGPGFPLPASWTSSISLFVSPYLLLFFLSSSLPSSLLFSLSSVAILNVDCRQTSRSSPPLPPSDLLRTDNPFFVRCCLPLFDSSTNPPPPPSNLRDDIAR